MKDKDDVIISAMSIEREASANAVTFEDGEIVVPHGPGARAINDGNDPGDELEEHTVFLPLVVKQR